jgi:hypothetical protein
MVDDNSDPKRRRRANLERAAAAIAAALVVAAAIFLTDTLKSGPTSEATRDTCPLQRRLTSAPVTMSEPACAVIASDTSAEPGYESFWGELQCAEPDRYHWSSSGGDLHRTAAGRRQGNEAYRRVTVLDGDDFSGERCELGEDDWKEGPTAFYRQGDHYLTYISERLPDNFPLGTNTWQTVMQMKQTQPSDGGGGAPRIEMEAREHRWVIDVDWHELWSFPARRNFWTRFAWDVSYSQVPGHGLLQVSADLNGDGDFDDPGERSPTFHVATLKTEIEGPNGDSDGIAAGAPIPGHLRAGIYHNPAIHCPAPKGCSVEVDNVQVLGPSPAR